MMNNTEYLKQSTEIVRNFFNKIDLPKNSTEANSNSVYSKLYTEIRDYIASLHSTLTREYTTRIFGCSASGIERQCIATGLLNVLTSRNRPEGPQRCFAPNSSLECTSHNRTTALRAARCIITKETNLVSIVSDTTVELVLKLYTSSVHELFTPWDEFSRCLTLEYGYNTWSCFTNKDITGYSVIMFMETCSCELWKQFTGVCIAEYSTYWFVFMDTVLSGFLYRNEFPDIRKYLEQFLDNLLIVCDADGESLVYSAYKCISVLLEEFHWTLFNWFLCNRIRVLKMKEKYSRCDPIEKMNIKYDAIRNAFDKLDIVPWDLSEHIIKYVSDHNHTFDQDEM